MLIKTSGPSLADVRPLARLLRSPAKAWIIGGILLIACLLAVSLASVYYGMYLYKVKAANTYDEFFENIVKTKLDYVPNLITGQFYAKPEQITIDVKHKHFQQLAYKREIALQSGILLTSGDDFVPADIRYQDRIIPAKIRLKGDWTDHLLGDKWSFRLRVKGDNNLFGMKQFSIHHPRTRNYIYEWLFHEALRKEDVIAPRYDFIEVILNGKNLGIYALEEHFEKRLIEHNRLREGPIIKLNEDLLWADRVARPWKGSFEVAVGTSEGTSYIDAFQINSLAESPTLYKQFLIAQNLLESFRYRELPASKVFDVPKMAKFFALSDMMGAAHSLNWHNLRFYFNPVTSVLEPIGFDANAGQKIGDIVGANRALLLPASKFKDLIFSDEFFFAEYVKALERMSDDAYLQNLAKDLKTERESKLAIIYQEFPEFHFTDQVFVHNQRVIRAALNPLKGFHAYYEKQSGSQLALQVGNVQSMPVQLLSVTCKDSVVFAAAKHTVLQARQESGVVEYESVAFTLPAGFAWVDSLKSHLRLNYKVLGATELRSEDVFSWTRQLEGFNETDLMRQPANFKEFDFISVDDSARRVIIRPGDWRLDRNLVIPSGYEVVCGEGTRLDLTNNAVILTYSPLRFAGSEENPIKIVSSDSTGQGVVVISGEQPSELRYVRFDNLSNPSQGGWKLTGAVTFYRSPVHVYACEFANNRCEDALNIFRAEYTIDRSLFRGTQSDAFDGDFTQGVVSNTSFVDCGNDGIDVSGSYLEVKNVFVNNSGDKGLSAGEDSRMVCENIEIINSEIAVASKDMSDVVIDGIRIVDCGIGFTAYQKKPEFARATIKAKNVKENSARMPFLIEENSAMVADGKEIPPSRQNVKEILYGVEFGKASKR